MTNQYLLIIMFATYILFMIIECLKCLNLNGITFILILFNMRTPTVRLQTSGNHITISFCFNKLFEVDNYHDLWVLDLHFSAGIGRTGTFIALDALHRQGQKTGRINIVEYVHTMREDRMNMIQNAVCLFVYVCCFV